MPAPTDHAARRREIAEAVWVTIHAHGIQGTTMRRVAAAGGISVGRIQHYFASRDELVRFSCQAMVEAAASAQSTPTQPAAPTDPVEALKLVRRLLIHAFDQSPSYRLGARVWAAYVAQAVLDRGIADLVVQAQSGLEREVARLLDAAGLNPHDARRLVALSEGLAQRALTGAVSTSAATAEIDRTISDTDARRWTRVGQSGGETVNAAAASAKSGTSDPSLATTPIPDW